MTIRSLRTALSLCVLVAFAATTATAQLFVISMAEGGKVFVNDTLFFNLPSEFDVNNGVVENADERWWDQQAVGSDLYHLRLDGQLRKNGERLSEQLPRLDGVWFRLAVTTAGDVWAFDARGRVGLNGDVQYQLPQAVNTGYQDFIYDQGDRYQLRSDGPVYMNTSGTPAWTLPGNAGAPLETWMSLAFQDSNNRLFALRRDGVIRYVESGGPTEGEFVTDLPVGNSAQRYNSLYIDQTTNLLYALRDDGVVYIIDPSQTPASQSQYADYPGDGTQNQYFRTMALVGTEVLALRYDGELFLGLLTDPLCALKGSSFHSVSVTTMPPVSTNVKEFKTVVSTYKTDCYPGDLVEFPILASDVNTNQLTYTEIAKPAGSTLDLQATPPTFSFTPAAEGKFELQVEISDGVKTKTYKYKIGVKAADTDPEKNKKPKFQKLKKVQGLVGVPMMIPLRAYDADGDNLSYSIQGELPHGMTFDEQSATLTWTPVVCSGKIKITLLADDGSGKLAKGKVQITVVTPFWF